MTLLGRIEAFRQKYFPPDPTKIARQRDALQKEMEHIALEISQSIEDHKPLNQKALLCRLREIRLKTEQLTSA